MSNKVELDVPEEDLVFIDIDGYKFFRGADYNKFQCATCIKVMELKTNYSPQRGRIRITKLIKDCDCPKQT